MYGVWNGNIGISGAQGDSDTGTRTFPGPLPDRRARLGQRFIGVSQSHSLISLKHDLVSTYIISIYSRGILIPYGSIGIVKAIMVTMIS